MTLSIPRLRVPAALAAAALALLVLYVAPESRAAELRVALVRAPEADSSASGTAGSYARIRAELLAGGLSLVTLVESDATAATTLESAAIRVRSIAAVSVELATSDQPEAYVWLTPGPDRKGELVQLQVGASGEEGERLLALRVADLLFASLVELEPLRRKRESLGAAGPELEPPLPEPKSQKQAAPAVKPSNEPAPAKQDRPMANELETKKAPHERMADVALGGSAFVSFFGLPATFAPTAMGGWWLGRRWRLGGILSAPAAGLVQDEKLGSANFDQEIVAADLHFAALELPAISLHTIVGAGAFRLFAKGSTQAEGFDDGSGQKVRGLVLVGTSGHVALADPLWLVVRADVAFVARPPMISFNDIVVANVGFPLVLFTLAFEMGW